MKKVLFVVVCIILAQVDYMLMQKLAGKAVKFYDFSIVSFVDWGVKAIFLGIVLVATSLIKMEEKKSEKAVSFFLTILSITFVVPVLVSIVHSMFFGKKHFADQLRSMLHNVSMTETAILAHLIVSLLLATFGFIYVYYFLKQPKPVLEVKDNTETASDSDTNEDG